MDAAVAFLTILPSRNSADELIVRATSPTGIASPAAVEESWGEARRLAGLVNGYSRATTAAKALCGIHLRAIRDYYFGPRNPNGGRPRKPATVAGFPTWVSLLADKVGIVDETATNWIRMADAVETTAKAAGLDLTAICQKLPWEWTPEEASALDAAVHQLTENKTQRELLQTDCLATDTPSPRPNASNNPTGKNGSDKKRQSPPKDSRTLLRERQEAARLTLFGTTRPGRVDFGSPARFMFDAVENGGSGIEALPRTELRHFHDHVLKSFSDLIRTLLKRP